MKDNEYKCCMCNNIYEKGWTDEEAMKECEENFGVEMANTTENDIVCDDCYNKICPKQRPHETLMAQQEFFLGRN